MIVPVILSGGSGTRLWPLSRERSPKQLLPLVTAHTMLQDTVLRLDALSDDTVAPIIVCNEAHGDSIRTQLDDVSRSASRLIFEPEGRNTAPAVAVAALVAEKLHSGTDPILLVLSADHLIERPEALADAVDKARDSAEAGELVTFGIVPAGPETGYGYIRRGSARGPLFAIDRFVEKPDFAKAKEYLASGDYYWNSGMFMFTASAYLAELGEFVPEIAKASRGAVAASTDDGQCVTLDRESFLACPKDSIDYAVMERTRKAAVVPLDAGWSDVGSWSSLHDVCEPDADRNVVIGDVETFDCRGSYFRAENRLVVGIGLDDFIVVDTSDALFVAPKSRSQDVKVIVERLRAADREET